MTFDARRFLASVPSLPGVYRYFDAEGEPLYVGKAADLRKRVASYFQKRHGSPRTSAMVERIARAEFTVTANEKEALLLENNLIKALQPRFNVLFRDDKSYPYILITAQPFGQIRFFRGAQQRPNSYFGPYPSAWAVREAIGHVQRIFQLRTCDDSVFQHRSRPCLLHQIKRCSAPCVGLIDEAGYRRDREQAELFLAGKQTEVIDALAEQMQAAAEALEFERAAALRDRVRALQRILTGQFVESGQQRDADVITTASESGVWCVNLVMIRGGRHLGDRSFFPGNTQDADAVTVIEAFIDQHYAESPPPARVIVAAPLGPRQVASVLGAGSKLVTQARGEARTWIMMGERNAAIALAHRLADSRRGTQREQALAQIVAPLLGEGRALQRIECFDISHTLGEATVAACVVYDQGRMQTSEYRRYNVRGVIAGDDYGAMRQALSNRYRKLAEGSADAAPPPDLVLIDGGRGQLNAACAAMAELGLPDLPLLGVAKGESRRPGEEQLVWSGGSVIRVDPADPGLHLIQQIRDEAHRFAITGHRAKRGRARTTSSLESIDGVGPKKRAALLRHFGGLQGVKSATIDDLARVDGISRELAERVYRALR
jgi:excinuclease ABC subunit C